MKRLWNSSAAVVCLSLAVGCGGGTREADAERDDIAGTNAQAETDEPTGTPAPASVMGCLSAAEGRYVLTELKGDIKAPGGPAQPTTETYQLTGADEKLREHVGKQVRVTGEAEPARIAEVRESTPSTPAAPAGTAGRQGTNQAEVSTETRTRLETRRMTVMSVTPTGDDCPAGTATNTQR